MSTNETMTMDYAGSVTPFKDTIEGWKWAGSTIKEIITQDHLTIGEQNKGFMSLVTDKETPEDRYADASQHIREIRDYKRGVFRDVLGMVTVVSLAMCGVRTVNISR